MKMEKNVACRDGGSNPFLSCWTVLGVRQCFTFMRPPSLRADCKQELCTIGGSTWKQAWPVF